MMVIKALWYGYWNWRAAQLKSTIDAAHAYNDQAPSYIAWVRKQEAKRDRIVSMLQRAHRLPDLKSAA
jgi:hypothetical protein